MSQSVQPDTTKFIGPVITLIVLFIGTWTLFLHPTRLSSLLIAKKPDQGEQGPEGSPVMEHDEPLFYQTEDIIIADELPDEQERTPLPVPSPVEPHETVPSPTREQEALPNEEPAAALEDTTVRPHWKPSRRETSPDLQAKVEKHRVSPAPTEQPSMAMGTPPPVNPSTLDQKRTYRRQEHLRVINTPVLQIMDRQDWALLNKYFEYSRSGIVHVWDNTATRYTLEAILEPAWSRSNSYTPCRNGHIRAWKENHGSSTIYYKQEIIGCRTGNRTWSIRGLNNQTEQVAMISPAESF